MPHTPSSLVSTGSVAAAAVVLVPAEVWAAAFGGSFFWAAVFAGRTLARQPGRLASKSN